MQVQLTQIDSYMIAKVKTLNCILIVPQMYLVHLKNEKLISGNEIRNIYQKLAIFLF